MQYKKMNANKLIRVTIPLLTILLIVSPMPASAGILDTISNKVTQILNRVKTILSNTNGLQDVVTTLRDTREGMGDGVLANLQEGLGDARNLLQFIKERRDMAGQTSQYPSLPNLIRSLDDIADVLADRPRQGGALEGLSVLLDVLPDRLLAPVARVVSRTGIDAEFVARIEQMAGDLVELRDILKEADAQQDAVLQQAEASALQGPQLVNNNGLLIAAFQCPISDNPGKLIRLNRSAKAAKGVAVTMKLAGATIETVTDAVNTSSGFGIWGWVEKDIRVKPGVTVGKSIGIVADGTLALVEAAQKVIDRCVAQALGEEILTANSVVHVQVCELTRYRSLACQALQL